MSDRLEASARISARDSTANTPGPLSVSEALSAPAAAANAARTSFTARAWASRSDAAARVSATSRARLPSGENQTPWRVSGPAAGSDSR